MDDGSLWAANHMVSREATDRGRNRIPTLTVKDPITKQVIKEARTNAEKGELLYQAFFPKRTAPPVEVDDDINIQEKWIYVLTTDEQIHRAIRRMKPWKATQSDTIPIVVVHSCERATGTISRTNLQGYRLSLKIYPEDWKLTETLILKKPGKSDYMSTGAWRPIVLSNGYARLLNSCKTEDLVVMCEKMGILPMNHFGDRLGRAMTD